MTPDADAVADCVLRAFDHLPEKRKPRPRSHGAREWVPLAGIVLSKAKVVRYPVYPWGELLSTIPPASRTTGAIVTDHARTGMKCLPCNKLPLARGNILHDWHAEVVAIRAFNRFLLDECLLISSPPYPTSHFIQPLNPEEHASQPFTVRDDVSIHMYCSEAPCGDASMELTMAAQEDATPWTSEAPTIQTTTPSSPGAEASSENSVSALRGRSNFSHLGVVRAKPSRPDAPPTLSKSCTDKLALKQATSLLSSTVSLFICPKNAYLATLVLPASQYVPQACDRAFSPTGRLESLFSSGNEPWEGGYRFQPLTVRATSREFAWSRRALAPGDKAMPSNLSAVWTPHWQETLIGGVLQGRKQLDPRGASRISRSGMWAQGVRLAAMVGSVFSTMGSGALLSKDQTYGHVKDSSLLKERKRVKKDMQSVLKGWIRNTGDDNWSLDNVVLPPNQP